MLLDLKNLIKKYDINIRGVIHIGAHFGQEFKTYENLNIKNIMFFEPLPNNFFNLNLLYILKKIKDILGGDDKSSINSEYNVASTGLNLDNSVNQVAKGQLTYALNAFCSAVVYLSSIALGYLSFIVL